MKTDEEIETAIAKIYDMKEFPGMTYKEGIRAAFDWILGDITDEEFFED